MPPGRKYAKGAAKREEVLDAALELITQRGWDAVTIRELASIVGLSPTALVHHVGSKDELLLELLRRRDRPGGRSYEELDADAGFRLMLSGLQENRRVSGLSELYIRLSAEATAPDHLAHEFFRDRYRNLGQTGVRAFTEVEDAGRLPDGIDPATAALMVIGMIDGLELQSFFRPEIDVVTQVQAVLRLLGVDVDRLLDDIPSTEDAVSADIHHTAGPE
ncbi:TetR/AcrR family transcriptional regulator [Streptomyces fulvoviolaceus]|uniref:TetR/AcrR family transcriptional regulator n=1 Tax=Streptomyces fulvoviolaceus TaxID=285535 RepID=UPI000996B5AC|nr:TetR/AcrR family transcriptional regulator [Streptomyces fulvoviolaceus]